MSRRRPDPLAHEAFALHEALMAWLRATHPRANMQAVLTALAYEMARIVALMTDGEPDLVIDATLRATLDAMREHIAAYRSGKLPPNM